MRTAIVPNRGDWVEWAAAQKIRGLAVLLVAFTGNTCEPATATLVAGANTADELYGRLPTMQFLAVVANING